MSCTHGEAMDTGRLGVEHRCWTRRMGRAAAAATLPSATHEGWYTHTHTHDRYMKTDCINSLPMRMRVPYTRTAEPNSVTHEQPSGVNRSPLDIGGKV